MVEYNKFFTPENNLIANGKNYQNNFVLHGFGDTKHINQVATWMKTIIIYLEIYASIRFSADHKNTFKKNYFTYLLVFIYFFRSTNFSCSF